MRFKAVALAAIALLAEQNNITANDATNNPLDMKARILDRLLPLGGESRPKWLDKIIVRFSNPLDDYGEVVHPDGQLMLITYFADPPAHPDPECELVSYTVKSRNGEDLSKLIRRMLNQSPQVSEDEIVRTVVVDVNRRSISIKEREKLIRGLRKLRISPVLVTRICVDNCPRYDYWHDTGGELTHYTLRGAPGKDPQDQLIKWMDIFLSTY